MNSRHLVADQLRAHRQVARVLAEVVAHQEQVAGLVVVAGFVAVIVFHQPMLSLLHALGLTPARAYAMRPTPPLGVPQVISSAFWGGIWGMILVLLGARPGTGPRLYVLSVLFGAVVLTSVAWFIR